MAYTIFRWFYAEKKITKEIISCFVEVWEALFIHLQQSSDFFGELLKICEDSCTFIIDSPICKEITNTIFFSKYIHDYVSQALQYNFNLG